MKPQWESEIRQRLTCLHLAPTREAAIVEELTILGLSIGLPASYGLTKLMKSYLYGVSLTDPLTFAVIAATLMPVALAACYAPARRATKVDPMIAMRCE